MKVDTCLIYGGATSWKPLNLPKKMWKSLTETAMFRTFFGILAQQSAIEGNAEYPGAVMVSGKNR